LAFFVDSPRPGPAGRQPVLNLPPMVQALLILLAAVHLVRLALPQDWDWWAIETFAFIPARYSVAELFDWGAVVAPVTHMLLHGGWLHLIVNMATLMAFGAGVERRIGGRRLLGFAIVCGLAGAAAHYLVYMDSLNPVIGASGAISGLFGGVLRLLAGRRQGQGLRALVPIVLIWVAANVAFGLTGVAGAEEGIAWVAHLGGFFAGLVLFGTFDRPKLEPPA
jgi:membrane associated rhomboid family serine protease